MSLEELREFLQLLEVTLRFWQKHSPHGNHSAFAELLRHGAEIHSMIDVNIEREKRK